MARDWAAYETVLRDLRAEKLVIENAIKAIEALAPKVADASQPAVEPPKKVRQFHEPAGPDGLSIATAALRVLKKEDKPTHVSLILSEIQKMGIRIGSADQANTVSSILSRRQNKKGDVVRVGRGTWALADRGFKFDRNADTADVGGEFDGVLG